MDIEEVYKEIKGIDLPEKDKEAFIRVIKLKTDSDMDKVINAINALKIETSASIGALNTRLDSSIGALKEGILSVRGEMNTSIGSLKWTIISVCTATAAIVGLIIKFLK